MYHIKDKLGYAPFILEHGGNMVMEDIIIDNNSLLELLLTKRFIKILDLKIVNGNDILVSGIGNLKLFRAMRCEEVKV